MDGAALGCDGAGLAAIWGALWVCGGGGRGGASGAPALGDVDACFVLFFFQAEDGIRDLTVTGVQTCALPIFCWPSSPARASVTSTREVPGSSPKPESVQPQVKTSRTGRSMMTYCPSQNWPGADRKSVV